MIRGVIDTSVLVSAVIPPTGPNAQLFDYIIDQEIRPYLTDAVLAEYYRVFDYDHLRRYDRRRVARLRSVLERVGKRVKPGGRLKLSSHEDDNRIYECAVAATHAAACSIDALQKQKCSTASAALCGSLKNSKTASSPTKAWRLWP